MIPTKVLKYFPWFCWECFVTFHHPVDAWKGPINPFFKKCIFHLIYRTPLALPAYTTDQEKNPLFFKLEEKCEKCLIDEAGSVHFPQVCLATKVTYQGVLLSSGRVQIDLWYKGLRVICTTSLCNNFFFISTWNKNHFLQTMLAMYGFNSPYFCPM